MRYLMNRYERTKQAAIGLKASSVSAVFVVVLVLAFGTLPASAATRVVGPVGEPLPGAVVGRMSWEEPASTSSIDELFDGKQFRAGLAAAAARSSTVQAQRLSRSEREARARSRTQFKGLDQRSALVLARQQFGTFMTGDRDSLRLRAGERVTGFPATNAATVVDRRGDRSLLLSSEPLAVERDGDLHQVDLALGRARDGYVPQRGASEVFFPEQVDQHLTVERTGFGLRPANAEPSVATLKDNRLFYADILADTDYVATPTRGGAEVMWQLRSADSPEQLGLEYDLPDGASIRLTSELTALARPAGLGDAEIVQNGEVLHTITAPVAFDASGRTLPASYRLEDGRLLVDVAHRGAEVQYPVLVDPQVLEVWDAYDFLNTCGGGPTNFGPGRWTYGQTASFTPICGEANGGGVGIFIQSEPWYYDHGQTAYWKWGAPAGAYIADAWFDNLRHQAAGTYVYTGLTGNSMWGSLAFHPTEFLYSPPVYQATDSPHHSFEAVVGLTTVNTFVRPHVGIGGVRGVVLRLGDQGSPTASLAGLTGGLDGQARSRWYDDQRTSVQASVRGRDGGLGVYELAVIRDVTGAAIGYRRYACAGHRSSRCPQDWTATLPLNLSQLSEGYNAIQTRAADIVGNAQSGPYWIQRIDRSNPTIDIAGELVEHATDGLLSRQPFIDVTARDGRTDGTANYRSGVESLRLFVNNELRRELNGRESSCENCSRGQRWYFAESELVGNTSITLEATDYVGHKATRSFTVVTYPTSRTYGGANQVIDSQDEIQELVNAMSTGTDAERREKWRGLDAQSRSNYVDALVPYAISARSSYGMTFDEPAVRMVFADAATHRTIAQFAAPMTTSEFDGFSDDTPNNNPYRGEPIASTSTNGPGEELPAPGELDELEGGDSDTGYGCDPLTESGCDQNEIFTESGFSPSPVEPRSSGQARASSGDISFSRINTILDANYHAAPGTGRRGIFDRIVGSDCTNFVSQSWHFGGGIDMNSDWQMRPHLWHGRAWTAPWGATRNFVHYWVNERRWARLATVDPSSRRLPPGVGLGDAIEYDWGTGDGWSHLAVVVDLRATVSQISQHSTDRQISPWRLGYMRETSRVVRANMRTRIVNVLVRP